MKRVALIHLKNGKQLERQRGNFRQITTHRKHNLTDHVLTILPNRKYTD